MYGEKPRGTVLLSLMHFYETLSRKQKTRDALLRKNNGRENIKCARAKRVSLSSSVNSLFIICMERDEGEDGGTDKRMDRRTNDGANLIVGSGSSRGK